MRWSFCFLFASVLSSQAAADGEEVIVSSGLVPAKASTSCDSAEVQQLKQRLERLELMLNASYLNPDVEDSSVMEMFMMQLRSKVFASIPPTDAECHFNWLFGRCYPLCKCRFAPKFGDFSPSRSCRLIPADEVDENCLPNQRQTAWFLRIAGAFVSAARAAHHTALVVGKAIADNAPHSDDMCTWSWRLDDMGCRPKKECALIFEMGDYSLDRMCRLRVEDGLEGEEGNVEGESEPESPAPAEQHQQEQQESGKESTSDEERGTVAPGYRRGKKGEPINISL